MRSHSSATLAPDNMFLSTSVSSALLALCSLSLAGSVSQSDLLPSYDYVIVGAGTSGLTVANRLSENSGKLRLDKIWRLYCLI